ncbi:S9 family peptidase [Aurantiacibacter sp. MUD11]|uniref:S9 family peptidase n=1 Tax=Aurantiacibacter sp. MUD11 TaxID=3003265 RepID=UPI0022AAB12B|nr:S9 family peptidase [Aurantiacibacter sp. MUD11]WAT17918.1 S9 family peptidase [Aurantiacibacter sp. MUD11]
MRLHASLLAATACVAAPAFAQDTAFGGQSGPDMSIEAMEPDGSDADIGLAGDEPADIARYLLASGAGGAALSPDGELIAFSSSVTGQPEVWIMPATGGQPQQLTFRTGPTFFAWTPDGSGLIYAADRDGNEQPGYFWISRDGTEERSILPAAAGDFRIFGGFADDGSYVYSSPVRNGRDFDIWRGDLEGNSELIYEGTFGYYTRGMSPDGRYAIITEGVGEDADNLHLLDLETRELTTISAPPVEDRASHSLGGFEWTADSSAFLFSSSVGREFGALSEYAIGTGETQVYHAVDRDVGNLEFCGANNEYSAWTESQDGFDTLHLWHIANGESVAAPELPEGSYALDCEGDKAIVRVNGWQVPGDIYSFTPGETEATRVYASNMAGLDPENLVRPQVVRYMARDGVELQGMLYLPEGAGTGEDAPPVVFSVHGGPSGQSGPTWDPVTQYHVARGVAVFEPNVRGSTGLGRTYSTLDDRERRLDSVRDLVDLLAALDADGLVDGDRAAVMGGSYGGYMVNAVLADYPDAFAAGVSLFGVGNWITALEVASPSLKAADRIEYGDISEQRWRDFYGEISPVFRADAIRVPVLYSHGVNDPRVDIAETEVMVRALRESGVRADFIRIPDEGHGWRKLANRLYYFRKQAEFLEEVLELGEAG